jgi:hypothetical protein
MSAVVAAYRAAIRLYPRDFRAEYGPDLVLLLEHQLRDGPAARVVGRLVLDLAISIPTRHLEAHVHRPSSTFVTLGFAAIGVAAVLVALTIGSNVLWAGAALVVAAVAAAVATTSHRRSRLVTADRSATAQWWKLLIAGPAAVAAFVAVTTATGELPAGGWFIGMVVLLTALVTTGAGIVLGVTHLVQRPGQVG